MLHLRADMKQTKLPTVSLSSVVGVQRGGDEITLEDTVVGDADVDVVDTGAFLARLDEREERIVRMRARGATLREIGAAEGLTTQGVSRLLHIVRRKVDKEWEEST